MAAPDRSADVAAVRAGIEASNRGDLDAVLEIFHPELEFHIAPGLGNAGTYRGLDGYREGFGGWAEAWDEFRVDEFEPEPVGERHVVVDVRQSGRGHGSGIEVEMRLGYMFELRDGKVVRFHVLHDRDAAREAAKAGEAASRTRSRATSGPGSRSGIPQRAAAGPDGPRRGARPRRPAVRDHVRATTAVDGASPRGETGPTMPH